MGAEGTEGLTLLGSPQGGFTEEVTMHWFVKDAEVWLVGGH